MTDKEIRTLVEEQLRREIETTWGIGIDQYSCCISGSPKESMLAEFTRTLNSARIEVNEVYADDQGVLLQWGIPELL